MILPRDRFESLFKENYYLSKDYAKLFSTILKKKIKEVRVEDAVFYAVGRKVLGLHNFTDYQAKFLKKKRFIFARILNEDNTSSSNPTIRDYNVIPLSDYSTAYNNYKRSFRQQVRQALKNDLVIVDSEKYESDMRSAYYLYLTQVIRLKGYPFSYKIFRQFLSQDACSLWLFKHEAKLIGYAVIYENSSNVYLPFQGSSYEFFHLRPNNFIYDYLIKYAFARGKNVHLGGGVRAEGYEQFKMDAGAKQFKVQRYPRESILINTGADLWHKPAVKACVGFASRNIFQTLKLDKAYAYSSIPMT